MLKPRHSFSLLQIIIVVCLAILISLSLDIVFMLQLWLNVAISVFVSLVLVKGFWGLIHYLTVESELPIQQNAEISRNIPIYSPQNGVHVLFGAALDAINDAIIILDKDQRLIIANTTAQAKYTTYAIGARIETFIRTHEILAALDRAINEKSSIKFDLVEHFPAKRYYQINISAFLVGSENNYIISIKDETNLRAAEQMRADFLANSGHELRTPLAGISGFIETLKGPAKDDAKVRAKFLEIMGEQADRMGRLINDILALSKIELNEHLKPKSIVNLSNILESAIATIKAASKDKNPIINLQCPEHSVKIIGDSDEVQQVIINLIDNGLKYGTLGKAIDVYLYADLAQNKAQAIASEKWQGSTQLKLVANPIDDNTNTALVRIENSGPGIQKRNMPRLSERFYRIDTGSNEISGTGLGLAIVKHIITRHNGNLIVESKVDEKTAFSFILPMAKTGV